MEYLTRALPDGNKTRDRAALALLGGTPHLPSRSADTRAPRATNGDPSPVGVRLGAYLDRYLDR